MATTTIMEEAATATHMVREFTKFVHNNLKQGHDMSEENSFDYVPLEALRTYWTTPRITQVLFSSAPARSIACVPQAVKDQYLQTFSMVVYCNKTAEFCDFVENNIDDNALPLSKRPAEWPSAPLYDELFEKICKYQWMFVPLCFSSSRLQKRALPDERILPIKFIGEIFHGDAAVVQKIEIDDSHNHLVEKDPVTRKPIQRVFVLKTYHNEKAARAKNLFDNEVDALSMLMLQPSRNVITYHGSFMQKGTYNLLLEFAEGGNLMEYFTRTSPPRTFAEVFEFWKSLVNIAVGLDRIHQLMHSEGGSKYLLGIHEDIKPQNIVLCGTNPATPYTFVPKVVDFGLFSKYQRRNRSGSKNGGSSSSEALGGGIDRMGNQLHSAPECSHHAPSSRGSITFITDKADVFSLGTVFSDAAAWVFGGQKAQEEYRNRRSCAHRHMKTFSRASAYVGCFHDGVEPLPVIKQFHDDVRAACLKRSDKLTPAIIKIVETHMVRGKKSDRMNTRHLMHTFGEVLSAFEPAPASPVSPVSPVRCEADMALPLDPSANANPDRNPSSNPNPDPDPDPDPAEEDGGWSDASASTESEVSDVLPSSVAASPPAVNGSGAPVAPVAPVTPITRLTRPQRPGANPVIQVDEPGTSAGERVCSVAVVTEANHGPRDSGRLAQAPNRQSNLSLDSAASQVTMSDLMKTDIPRRSNMSLRRAKPMANMAKIADPKIQDLFRVLTENLQGRDQFFFIDDSTTMKEHMTLVKEAFRAISSVVEQLDPNGVELAFSSDPTRIYKEKRTENLCGIVDKHSFNGIPDLMARNVGTLVTHDIIKKLPFRVLGYNINPKARENTSFYIFTDGRWGPDTNPPSACGVAPPIEKLMDEMRKRKLNREQISLHFVRFGDDAQGKRTLHFLDKFGREKRWDIVDVKHVTGNAWSLFLGPITEASDIMDEDDESMTANDGG